MASVFTLLFVSLIVLFGCHYREVCAGHKGRGYGKGWDRTQVANKFRTLKFSLIISGRRFCRLQETMGWRMYREMTYCDTGITVTDPTEDLIDPIFRNVFDRAERPTDRLSPPIDNATRPTAYSLTRRRFCAHRYAIFQNYIICESKSHFLEQGSFKRSFQVLGKHG